MTDKELITIGANHLFDQQQLGADPSKPTVLQVVVFLFFKHVLALLLAPTVLCLTTKIEWIGEGLKVSTVDCSLTYTAGWD